MRKKPFTRKSITRTALALCLASAFALPAHAATEIPVTVDKRDGTVKTDNSAEGECLTSNFDTTDFDIKLSIWAGKAYNPTGAANAFTKAYGIYNTASPFLAGNNNITIIAVGGDTQSGTATTNANTSAKAEAYGIYNSNEATTGNNTITIKATGGNAIGANTENNAASTTATTFANADAYGIYNSGSDLTTKNNTINITAAGGKAQGNIASAFVTAAAGTNVYGIYNSSSGSIKTGNNTITITAHGSTAHGGTTSGYNSAYISAAASADGHADAYGIRNYSSGKIETKDNIINITATGGEAKAGIASAHASAGGHASASAFAAANAYVYTCGIFNSNTGKIETKDNIIDITARGGEAWGGSASASASTNTTASVTASGYAAAYGVLNYGLGKIETKSNNISITAIGGKAHGGNAEMNSISASAPASAAAEAYGLYNNNSGDIETNRNTISLTALGGEANSNTGKSSAYAAAFGIYNHGTGTVTARGAQDIYTEATAGTADGITDKSYAYALLAHGGSIDIQNEGEAVKLTGDIGVYSTGSITLTLDNPDSYWRPRFQDTAYIENGANKYEANNGSFGNGSFTIKDGAVLDLAWSANEHGNTFKNNKLDLTGSSINIEDGATFIINSDLANNLSDTVSSTATATGKHYVQVAYDPAMTGDSVSITGRVLVLDFKGANAQSYTTTTENPLTHNTTNVIMEGGWLTGISYVNTPSELGLTASDHQQSQLNVLRTQANSLTRRLGDLRGDNPQAKHGIWARTYGGKLKSDGAYGRSSSQKYHAMQFGYDWIIDSDNGKYVTGILVDHMLARPEYERGNGKIKSTAFGGYLAWLGDKGHYFDIVAKAAKMRNKYNLSYLSGDYASSSYSNWGYTLSMEYGYRHKLNERTFLEPQAELLLGRLQGKDYTASNSVRISQDSVNMAIGRLGVMYGWNFGKELKNNAYLKGSIVHDFSGAGNLDSYFGSDYRKIRTAGDAGTSFELNLGTNLKLSQQDNLYFELTKSFGGNVETDWQVNAGWRMSF